VPNPEKGFMRSGAIVRPPMCGACALLIFDILLMTYEFNRPAPETRAIHTISFGAAQALGMGGPDKTLDKRFEFNY
jgi:hypothetical protein